MRDLKEHTISLDYACVIDTLSGFKKGAKYFILLFHCFISINEKSMLCKMHK